MPLTYKPNLLKNRRTKIIATLGPTSDTPEVQEQLLNAGVNVVRLNMSHGTHESHAKNYHSIRDLAKKLDMPVAILVDLSGPKMRCGKFVDGEISLVEDELVIITVEDVLGKQGELGKPAVIPSQYAALADDVVPTNRILFNDGAIEVQVVSVAGKEITAKVINGGILKNHKGINLPGVKVSAPALTEKDKADALFATTLGADYIALSFVQKASDILELRKILEQHGSSAHIIAKIEKPEALDNIDEILEVSDGIMIARGDLGVEVPPEELPAVQDQLISLARTVMKPVIVATQMLESMITNPRPTRAEVTDVSNAVNCCVDAVMLSAETASGKYPVQSVQIMSRVARRTEARLWKEGVWGQDLEVSESSFSSVIAKATARMSRDLMSHAVMVDCKNMKAALIIGSARPASPIIAIVSNKNDYQRLALVWGVIPILHKESQGFSLRSFAKETAVELNLAAPGDCILLVEGFNDTEIDNSPSVTIIKL